jgi:hypothetical protein
LLYLGISEESTITSALALSSLSIGAYFYVQRSPELKERKKNC